MSKRMTVTAVFLALMAILAYGAKMPDHGLFRAGDEKWGPAPDVLPAGAELAVLEGNPMKAGIYTMRLKMPANYRIAPHWHPEWEHVTVISGAFHLGMGEKFDESKGMAMPVGTFGFLAPHMKHYAWASEPTVIQLHGRGPWKIIYVNPKDNPAKK